MTRKEKRFKTGLAAFTAALLLFSVLWALRSPRPEPQPLILRPLPVSPSQPYRLDLNTATAGELDSLPDIGPVIAQRMVDWREEKGPFTSREDVLSVDGIGEKTYEAIEPYITYK